MDARTLGRLFTQAARMLPPDLRNEVADVIDKVGDVVVEFAEGSDDAVLGREPNKSQSIYDDVRNDVGNPPGSFEDIVAGWDTQPDRETGGSENDKDVALDIVDSIYRFLTEYHNDYAPYTEDNAAWNREHPVYAVIDFIAWLGEQQLTGRFGTVD